MQSGNFGQCSGCGKRIVWIKTVNGKNMPCDPNIINYKADKTGKEKIVTASGNVVTGTTGATIAEADGFGYISHFATCPRAKTFRKRNY